MNDDFKEGILLRFDDEVSYFSIVFDDDGKVAYAYLLENGKIIGDVWLYNRGDTPDEPEWTDRTKMPFANPREFVSDSSVEPAEDENDIDVEWKHEHGQTEGSVFLRGMLLGKLRPGANPGWSALAIKDGPLAKVLVQNTV